MNMRKTTAKIRMAVLLILTSFAICGMSDAARAEDNQVIRVAYPIQDGMTEFDEYGNHSGYIYEYLEEIAQYTGWDYEFVTPPGDLDQSLSDALSMVERGEIDLLGGLLYSRELDQQFDYSEYNSGQVETVLQVLYDDPYNIVIDSQVDQKLKVAVRNSTGRMAKELQEYCKLNLVTPEFILCKNAEEQVQAMRDGRAEAMLNNSLNRVEGVRTLAGFASKPFYFVTGQGKNADLMADLNAAMLSIRQSDPYFALTLEEKYFAPKMELFLLSEREKEYIKNNQEIQVGVLENQPPFQYRDNGDQSIHGISIDLLNYIAHGTGLQLHMKTASNPEQLYVMAKNKEIDLVAGMPYHYNLAREHNLTLSRPYISSQTVMMVNENTKRKQADERILAITQSDRQPVTDSAKTMKFSTWAECIKAVDAGVADYVYVDTYTAQYYVNIPQYSDLKLVPQTSKPYKICFGLSKPSDAVLLGILNKAVMAISDNEMQAMTYQNILRETPLTFAEFAQKNIWQTMLVTIGIFLIIIAMLTYILQERVRSSRKLSLELKKHLQVYAIAKECFFEYNYQTGKLMFSEPEGEKGDPEGTLNFDYSKYPDDPMTPQRQERFLEIIRSESNRSYEIKLPCADGEEHWVRITVETIRDDAGVLAYSVGKINLFDNEKKEYDMLLDKSQRDSLTSAFNAETMAKLIRENLSDLHPEEYSALIIIDVDRFKEVNDTYGHLQGDHALCAVADLLRVNFREGDIVGRPGGDEFMVYMKDINGIDILSDKCNAICKKIQDLPAAGYGKLTISLGAALCTQGVSYEVAYRSADQALYRAKEDGRNCFKLTEATRNGH